MALRLSYVRIQPNDTLTSTSLDLPPSIPARGNRLSRAFGRLVLRSIRWKIDGALPDFPKLVIIVAPHTSNWDFPLGVAVLFALGLRLSFLAKRSLFRPPIGTVMRWLGGIPVTRVVHEATVAGEIDAFKRNDRWVLAIAPEGTRKYIEKWRSGFYHVAVGAGAHIVPVAFDYSTRTICIMPTFQPTGNSDADIIQLRNLYRATWALKPENFQEMPPLTG